jgi:hypothetical protein
MNSHWSIKFFRSDHLLIEIVESAISLSDQFSAIRFFEKIIFLLRSSNRNLFLCSNICTVKFFDSIIFIEIVESKIFFFVSLILFIDQILESYDHLHLKIVEFANQIFFSFWLWSKHFSFDHQRLRLESHHRNDNHKNRKNFELHHQSNQRRVLWYC